ncbi:hypothetical protein BgiMline_001066 [Biomphalaria glabrata]|nr:hypothetical protein BgiMline_000987 [Biomphalaria glabrata]
MVLSCPTGLPGRPDSQTSLHGSQLPHWATLETRLTNLLAWFSAAPLGYPGDQTHKPPCMVLSCPTGLPGRPDSQTSLHGSQLPHWATLETRLTNLLAWFSAAPLGYPGDQTHKPPCMVLSCPTGLPWRPDSQTSLHGSQLPHWATLETRLTNLLAWFSAAPLGYPGDQTHKPPCMVLSCPTVLPRRSDSQTSLHGSQLPHWATLETRLTNLYAWFSAAPLNYPGDQTHKPLCMVLSCPTGLPGRPDSQISMHGSQLPH